MNAIPVTSQIFEIRREIESRRGTIRDSLSSTRMARVSGVSRTLEWVQTNRAAVEQFWAERGEPMPIVSPEDAVAEEKPGRIGIVDQIVEIERVLAGRRMTYGTAVSRRTMRDNEAALLLARMEAVLGTLQWCRTHRPAIDAWAAAKREAAQAGLEGQAA